MVKGGEAVLFSKQVSYLWYRHPDWSKKDRAIVESFLRNRGISQTLLQVEKAIRLGDGSTTSFYAAIAS
jgi:hypothetical protein